MSNIVTKTKSLFTLLVKYYASPELRIIRINTESHTMITFYKVKDHQEVTISAKSLFANTNLIGRFSSKEAAKIGYLCAKELSFEKNKQLN